VVSINDDRGPEIVWIHLPKAGGINHDPTIDTYFYWLSLAHIKGTAIAVTMVSAPQVHELQSASKEVGPNLCGLRMILERESRQGVDTLCPTELGDL